MKKVILLAVVAILLFSVTAGISYFLNNPNAQAQAKSKEGADEEEDRFGRDRSSDGTTDLPKGPTFDIPGPNPSVEELTRLLNQLNAEKLKLRESSANNARQKKQIDLATADLREQQSALKKKRDDIETLLKEVEALLRELEGKVTDLNGVQEVVKKGQAELNRLKTDDLKALKAQAKLFAAMDTADAATILGYQASQGGMEEVAKILAVMDNRSGGDILANISKQDQQVSAELVQKTLKARQMLNLQAAEN